MKVEVTDNYFTYDDAKEMMKIENEINEIHYQQEHRKVKDRYASNKFYMNNFKKNRRKKND